METSTPPHLRHSTCSYGSMAEEFMKKSEALFGKAHRSRQEVAQARRVIVKVSIGGSDVLSFKKTRGHCPIMTSIGVSAQSYLVGTAVVTRSSDYRLALGRLGALVEQLEALIRSGRQVILVTSGATAVGRQKLRMQQVLNSSPLDMQIQGINPVQGRAAAAAGQSGLMALYDSMFGMMDVLVAQFLVTATEFNSTEFRSNLKGTVDSLLENNVVPVFNENDAISTGPAGEQKAFADNDSLAALLAGELKADLLILMSDVDGVYTGDPKSPSSKLIHTYCPDIHNDLISFGEKSAAGRGGMGSKVKAAWSAALQGCLAVIANGKHPENILQIVAGQQVGTLFSTSEARRMMEVSESASQGSSPGLSPHATSSEDMAMAARRESRALQSLTSEQRAALLLSVADALEEHTAEIMAENSMDVQMAEGRIEDALMQRLVLSPTKIARLAVGIRAIAAQQEPVRRLLSRTEIADALILEKRTAPIGVLLIIFEARPDALPQIASLAIRSGNGLLLKGGKEAARSNACLHRIITDCLASHGVGPELIGLVTSRDEIDDLLKLDSVIDLVIPRGSNKLVSYIQSNTKIPVLGHADGICHAYIDAAADIDMAMKVLVDAKTDYPAACNAVEKILVHSSLADSGRLFKLQAALREANVEIFGGERAHHLLSLPAAPATRHEYGKLALTIEIVDTMDEAIEHIHDYGSGHTEVIVTDDTAAAHEFLRRVDSACVLHNCSTRFSDGFRFGLGAEVGISTSRIHARGPVGVEGLLTSKWTLRGHGDIVNKDTGVQYTHRALPISEDEA